MNNIKLVSILTLAILTSCSVNPVNNIVKSESINTTIQKFTDTTLIGEINFPKSFNTKATQEEIATQSTVSIIKSPKSNDANTTVAVGLTDNLGKFKIVPNKSFQPLLGEIYILEARKRLGGEGKPIITLKTFIKWTNSGWTSITGKNIFINTKTTALAILSGHDSSLVEPDDTIERMKVTADIVTMSQITANIDSSKIEKIDTLVKACLIDNVDPVQQINYLNGSMSYKSNSQVIDEITASKFVTFSGKVYDVHGKEVTGAVVSAYATDSNNMSWFGDFQETLEGFYVFRNAPVGGSPIFINVNKDGWASRGKLEILKSNLQGDPSLNIFDFKGIDSIQDEPEISLLKVNSQIITISSDGDSYINQTNTPKNNKPNILQLSNPLSVDNVGNIPSLSSIDSNNIEIEMTFSELIVKEDVENYFRITSQSGSVINSNNSGVQFIWSDDDKSVTFKTNKAFLANKSGDEYKYLIDFTQGFRDLAGNVSINRRYFKFGQTQINDFAVFSVKNVP